MSQFDNLLHYLPSNIQQLAQAQHRELEELRARVPALEAQIAGLEAEIERLEQLRDNQAANIRHLEGMAMDMLGQRDSAVRMLARLTRAGAPAFTLAGLASGLLAVFALRLWGW